MTPTKKKNTSYVQVGKFQKPVGSKLTVTVSDDEDYIIEWAKSEIREYEKFIKIIKSKITKRGRK